MRQEAECRIRLLYYLEKIKTRGLYNQTRKYHFTNGSNNSKYVVNRLPQI